MSVIDSLPKVFRNYSVARAIAGMSSGKPMSSLELEISQDISRRINRTTPGLFIPTALPAPIEHVAQRAPYGATINAAQGGANLVATNLLAGSFIDVLRNKTRVMQMGATLLDGLTGNIQIPRQDTTSTATWVAEGVDPDESEAVFDSITLSPNTVMARSQWTRQLLMQETPAIEVLVRNDLSKALAVALDLAAIAGTGTGGQPTGILNKAGINTIALGTNGAAATIDNLIDMEMALAAANVEDPSVAYLTNAKVIGALRKLKDTTGRYLWNNAEAPETVGQNAAAGWLNGAPAWRTNQVPSNLTKGTGTNLSAIILANWSDLIIGEWGVLEILPNPYGAGFNSGSVDVRAALSCNVALRHPQSFVVIADAVA